MLRLDPASGRVVARISAPGDPCALALAPDAAWIADLSGALIEVRGDARRIPLPGTHPCGVAATASAAWASTADGSIVRVDAARWRVDWRTRASRGQLGGVTLYRGAVWASDLGRGEVVRVDAATGRPLGRVAAVGQTEQLAPAAGAVWAIAAGPGRLVRIDARTGRVRRFPIGPFPKAIATGDGAVWVALSDRRLLRFDPARLRGRVVARLPEAPILLAASGGTVWSLPATGRLARLDERNGSVRPTLDLRRRPFGLAADRSAVWAGVRGP